MVINFPFVDVKEDTYYYDSVEWAISLDEPVTTGVDETHFVPDNLIPCETRKGLIYMHFYDKIDEK